MKYKLILWTISAIVVAMAILSIHREQQNLTQTTERFLGHTVLPARLLPQVRALTVRKGNQQVTISKEAGGWTVQQRAGYPANYEQLRQVLILLSNTRILDLRAVLVKDLEKLDLTPATARVLTLYGEGKRLLAEFYLGKAHPHPLNPDYANGSFMLAVQQDIRHLSPQQEVLVMVIPEKLKMLQPDPDLWLDTTFPKIAAKELRRVTLLKHEGDGLTPLWALERVSPKSPFVPSPPQEGVTVNASNLELFLQVLANFSFQTVAPRKDSESLPVQHQLLLNTWNGVEYRIEMGSPNRDRLMPVTVSITHIQNDRSEQPAHTEIIRQNKLYRHWVYLLPASVYTAIPFGRNDMLIIMKRPEKRSTPVPSEETEPELLPDAPPQL